MFGQGRQHPIAKELNTRVRIGKLAEKRREWFPTLVAKEPSPWRCFCFVIFFPRGTTYEVSKLSS